MNGYTHKTHGEGLAKNREDRFLLHEKLIVVKKEVLMWVVNAAVTQKPPELDPEEEEEEEVVVEVMSKSHMHHNHNIQIPLDDGQKSAHGENRGGYDGGDDASYTGLQYHHPMKIPLALVSVIHVVHASSLHLAGHAHRHQYPPRDHHTRVFPKSLFPCCYCYDHYLSYRYYLY